MNSSGSPGRHGKGAGSDTDDFFVPGRELIGGFEPNDGTIDFYLRVRSLLGEDSAVLDLGAGRGAWFEDDFCETRKRIRSLRGDCRILVGADIDPIVAENRSTDENFRIEDGTVPVDSDYFDLVVADYVLEHVVEVDDFLREMDRVLKPGGWFCARTPHRYSYVALASNIVGDALESRILSVVQPGREDVDVFPKHYKMNTHRRLASCFGEWSVHTQVFRANPAYFGRRKFWYVALHRVSGLLPGFFVGVLFVFVQKPVGRDTPTDATRPSTNPGSAGA